MDCMYCKTENQDDATKCRACGSWIVERPPLREWTRASEGRRIAGVCRGLAHRFGVPVAALRLLLLGSILLGGWGVLAYIALWIALPLDSAPRQPVLPRPAVGEPALSNTSLAGPIAVGQPIVEQTLSP